MRVRRLVPGVQRGLVVGLLAAFFVAPLAPPAQGADTCGAPLGLPNFDTPLTFAVQDQPFGMAVGDWNRDGNLDIAVSNSGPTINSVSTRFGNGAGGFVGGANIPIGTLPTPTTPQDIATGDFNGDGFPDLVVATPGTASIHFLQGSATGTFALSAQVLNVIGPGPYAFGVADFNGDGRQDLAVTIRAADKVFIYLRTGAFTFAAPTTVGLTKAPGSLTVGDFDRDGDLDIVSGSLTDGNISFLRNNGAGVFTQPNPAIAAGFNVVAVTSGDFDKDGILDLAVVIQGTANVILTYKGAGDGTFSPQLILAHSEPPLRSRSRRPTWTMTGTWTS